jgi:hypothetical protein
MAKFKVQGEYTYTVFKIVEAEDEENAIDIAIDSEPLCSWDTVEQDSYFENVLSATKEKS